MRSRQNKQTPLEVLVFSQLAAIRKHEAALQSRLNSGVQASASMAEELVKLQISADRLNRLVNAMA